MKTLSEQKLQHLFEASPQRHYKKGHIFLLPGEVSRYTYYLHEGKVKVYDVNYRGDEFTINSFGPPAVFPLSMVFSPTPTRYIYEAASDVVVQQTLKSNVMSFMENHPDITLELFAHLYTRVDKIIEKMIYSISGTAKVRLIYALVTECKDFGTRNTNGSYNVLISEKELGYKSGLSRETVNREMKTLKMRKLIEINHAKLTIPELSKLERYLQ